MTIKVHGGPKLGTNIAGSLRHFKIESNDANLAAGVGIPNSGLDVLVRTLELYGTIVILNVATEYAYVAFENTTFSVVDHTALEAIVKAIGTVAATVAQPDGGGVSGQVAFGAAVVTEPGYVL